MTTIGTLSVELTAKTAQLTRGLGHAAKQVTSFGGVVNKVGQGIGQGLSTIGNHLSRMGPAGTAAGMALDGIGQSLQGLLSLNPAQFFSGLVSGLTGVASTLAGGVFAEMQRIDVISKASRRIGETTEALAGLEHAAGLSGVEFGNLVKGLERGSRSIAEAAIEGTGAAADAIKQLGLDALQLQHARPVDQLLAISEAINRIPTAGEKLQVLNDIFGRQGIQFLNLLEGGPGALREMIAEAETLGMTFDSIQGSAVEAANDAISRLTTAMNSMFTELAATFAPFIDSLATKAVPFARKIGETLVFWVRAAVEDWDEFLGLIEHSITLIEAKIGRAVSQLASFGFADTAAFDRQEQAAKDTLGTQVRLLRRLQEERDKERKAAAAAANEENREKVQSALQQEIMARKAPISGAGLTVFGLHMASQMALAAANTVQRQIAGPGTIEAGSAEGFRLQAQWQQPLVRQQIDIEQEQANLLSQILQELRGGPGEIELGVN